MSEQAPSFRLCTTADKPALVAFMDAHWGSKHPLMHCEDFFSHYYESDAIGCAVSPKPTSVEQETDAQGENAARAIQFAIAEESGKMIALAGYIWTAQAAPRDIWVSIWCAVKGKNGAGLELMAALPLLTGARVMACNNIRPQTMPFYTFLGYTTARLPHFYRLANKACYALARVPPSSKHFLPAQGTASLVLLHDKETVLRNFSPDLSLSPHKDAWYVARRYFEFPRQQYTVYAVLDAQNAPASVVHNTCSDAGTCGNQAFSALLVTRTVPVNGTAVLRIVDYIGTPARFASLGCAIDALMQDASAEYAECYCYGISSEIFATAGFCERTESDAAVIPNYLAPPLYENTEYYFFTSHAEGFTMFKADGDQDRPNITM